MSNTPKTADEWRKLARQASDPVLAAGYLAKADALDKAQPPGTHLGFVGPGRRQGRKYTNADLLKAIQSATPAEVAEFKAVLTGILPSPARTAPTSPRVDIEALKSAVFGAVKAELDEPMKGLSDELAAVRRMATPGGPVRAAVAKKTEPTTSAAYFSKLAAEVTDATLAASYRVKAAEAERRERGW